MQIACASLYPSNSLLCDESELDVANASELTTLLATLTERVSSHIRFFWGAVAAGFLWLAGLSVLLFNMNGNITRVQTAQANIPAQTVEALLAKSATSQSEMANKLAAVSTVLQTAKFDTVKADPALVNRISAKVVDAQAEYPELPQVWQATSALISYKSESEAPNQGIANGAKCTRSGTERGFIFTNCEVALEDISSHIHDVRFNDEHVPFIFTNCLIHYSGGALPDASMTFINSAFRFNVPIVPSKNGITTLQKLTTAEIDKPIEITVG
jgi:hypothetical protein